MNSSIAFISIYNDIEENNSNIVLFLIFTTFLQFFLLHCSLYGLAEDLIFFKINEFNLKEGQIFE